MFLFLVMGGNWKCDNDGCGRVFSKSEMKKHLLTAKCVGNGATRDDGKEKLPAFSPKEAKLARKAEALKKQQKRDEKRRLEREGGNQAKRQKGPGGSVIVAEDVEKDEEEAAIAKLALVALVEEARQLALEEARQLALEEARQLEARQVALAPSQSSISLSPSPPESQPAFAPSQSSQPATGESPVWDFYSDDDVENPEARALQQVLICFSPYCSFD